MQDKVLLVRDGPSIDKKLKQNKIPSSLLVLEDHHQSPSDIFQFILKSHNENSIECCAKCLDEVPFKIEKELQ